MKRTGYLVILIPLLFWGCSGGGLHTEMRTLEIPSQGVRVLELVSGNGDVGIKGIPGGDKLLVTGNIEITGEDSENIREALQDQLVFTLEKRGNRAVLESHFKKGFFLLSMFRNKGRSIHIDVELPDQMELDIVNSGGDLYVSDMKGECSIIDEGGECILENISADTLEIADGAGAISITGVNGNIKIDDKSEGIELMECTGEIEIFDTTDDIIIEECTGALTIQDTAGAITVENHTGDLTINARGRGNIALKNIRGEIIQNF